MGKITGREPGQPRVPLAVLKKDNAAKFWLFNKYYNLNFVDKNPEGEVDLTDEASWEHRVIKNVVWFRRHGYALETTIKDVPMDDQSIERYFINEQMIEMIRASPHNVNRIMVSRQDEVLGPAQPDTNTQADTNAQPVANVQPPAPTQVPTNGGLVANV